MYKRYIEVFFCFTAVLMLGGCACYEKEWMSEKEAERELSEKLPEEPGFPEYVKDEKTDQVTLKEVEVVEEPVTRRIPRRPRRPKPTEQKPADEKAEDSALTTGSSKPLPVREEKPAPVEEKPILTARLEEPLPEPVKSSPAVPVISSEKSYFEKWTGECLVYKAKWNVLNVGKALLAMRETSNGYGEVYHLVAVSVPEGMLANMGIGYYRIDSYLDKKTLLPHYYYQYSKNKSKEDIREIYFNWKTRMYRTKTRKFKNGKLYSTKNENVKLGSSAYDGISGFYMLRALDFENRSRFTVPLALNETWDLVVNRKDKRTENVSILGRKDVYIVEPLAKSDAGFFTQGKMDIWITADNRRIPVYLEGKAPFGTARFTLASEMKVPASTEFNIKTISQILGQVK